MSNPRSASNAWAKIKSKLASSAPDGASPAPTPKKAAAARKKKAVTAPETGEDGEPVTPKKTPRKRAAKKQDVEGEDASPTKKGRAAAKKSEESEYQLLHLWSLNGVVFNTFEIVVKTETDDSEPNAPADDTVPDEV
jgi:hypothetical protein